METILKYLPYVLLFAVATMIVYGWGLWRASRQNQDLANMLSAKGISAVKKVLKKKGPLTRKELEPFVKDLTAKQPFMQDSIGVTDPKKFLDSILPYMIKQKMILEERQNGKIFYTLMWNFVGSYKKKHRYPLRITVPHIGTQKSQIMAATLPFRIIF